MTAIPAPVMSLFDLDARDALSTLEETVACQADMLVKVLRARAFDGALELDYSESSLRYIGRVLDRCRQQYGALDRTSMLLLSAYMLEVAKATFGGRYVGSHHYKPIGCEGEYVLVVGEPLRRIYYSPSRKIRRYVEGDLGASPIGVHEQLCAAFQVLSEGGVY